MNYESTITRQSSDLDFLTEEEIDAKKKRRAIIIAAVVGVLLVIGYLLLHSGGGSDAATAGKEEKQVPRVTVIVPGREPVSMTVSATGNLAARREMPVGVVGEGGMVSRVWVEPGDWVQQGQVLASIERSVQSAERSQLAASVAAAEADARLAQSELDRASALLGRGFISQADIDRKTATRDSARARVAVARAQLGGSQARIGRLDIRAPAAGLVLTRAIEPGQVVGAGSGVLFRLARGGEMELKAQLAEGDLSRMSVGMPAKITPVGSDRAFDGQIWQLSPVVDPQTRQGIVRVSMNGYDKALRPGGFASVQIVSGAQDAPLLPESAVQSDDKGNFVYVVGDKNKIVRKPVQIGEVTDRGVAITGGLNGNEKVVMSAGGFLNPGETVTPVMQKK